MKAKLHCHPHAEELALDYAMEHALLGAVDVVVVLLVLPGSHIRLKKTNHKAKIAVIQNLALKEVLKDLNQVTPNLEQKAAIKVVNQEQLDIPINMAQLVLHADAVDVLDALRHVLEDVVEVAIMGATLLAMETVGKARVKETVQEHVHMDVDLVVKRNVILVVTLVAVEIAVMFVQMGVVFIVLPHARRRVQIALIGANTHVIPVILDVVIHVWDVLVAFRVVLEDAVDALGALEVVEVNVMEDALVLVVVAVAVDLDVRLDVGVAQAHAAVVAVAVDLDVKLVVYHVQQHAAEDALELVELDVQDVEQDVNQDVYHVLRLVVVNAIHNVLDALEIVMADAYQNVEEIATLLADLVVPILAIKHAIQNVKVTAKIHAVQHAVQHALEPA